MWPRASSRCQPVDIDIVRLGCSTSSIKGQMVKYIHTFCFVYFTDFLGFKPDCSLVAEPHNLSLFSPQNALLVELYLNSY